MTQDKPPKTFQRGAASSEIYRVLRDEIITHRLAPGYPLDETGLSKRFAVSRSPIREALNRLLAERLVETLPNRTTIVAQVDLRDFAPFILALDVQQRLATRLAAQNRQDADVKRMRHLAEAFNESVDEATALDILQANFAFHVAVGDAGRNPYVARQYRELLSEARRLLHIHVQSLDTVNRRGVMRDQHHDFVDAIEARDVAQADAIAHAHTMQFHDRFLTAMQYSPDAGFDIAQPSRVKQDADP
ncbi:GntR family transcriptional regulator [uncultured Sulfitobacter sp.]|uniref:GntR family transcriptional regulator n=1 Tax=uncultured Sulfitobacter sp. TaxID=191468 RepID=UPI0026322F9A|nr:GntR family transcriptional regulator [uncultured Sulfitobacter sp.]